MPETCDKCGGFMVEKTRGRGILTKGCENKCDSSYSHMNVEANHVECANS